ncbi:MAG: bifunctional diaminohydroxyphosphoribosylaminopyrimidine deaminase/5-amino-6-(5-phosphoribosylamino)uracil reductase RibD [Nitrospirae bacterium]|nr:bifunctional diaminohydroxyphosphoribosylaminopyrimidine deaminase/5-amino-6-(5-phosphoribosylamino)uracil reductase RibD [Nitrospirota bacterium]
MTRDEAYIKRAIELARRAAGHTSPNPMVGAVLVKGGRVIAEDYHRAPGTPHAEALVLREAGPKAKGATLYVSLEPCCHTKKRTPPCTKAIIASGVKKVVVAMVDPNPQVSGKGIKELERAGIKVVSGVLEERARKLNEAYIKYITQRVPFVTLKVAMTLDGKIALPTGESKWITGERARRIVHRMRAASDAILTAIGTVKADNPQLTARLRGAKSPIRVVIDPELETPLEANILKMPPKTILVTKRKNSSRVSAYTDLGAEFIFYEDSLDLNYLMKELGRREITSVMIEGGSSLASHALHDAVVDKVVFFVAPKIICGKDSYPAVGGTACPGLQDAYKLRDFKARRVGEDLMIEGYVVK